jgi:hypothetical protein
MSHLWLHNREYIAQSGHKNQGELGIYHAHTPVWFWMPYLVAGSDRAIGHP